MITTINNFNNFFITGNKLPLCHGYVFKGQTSYYSSGHHCTVTRRSVHLQVKDPGVRLTKGKMQIL